MTCHLWVFRESLATGVKETVDSSARARVPEKNWILTQDVPCDSSPVSFRDIGECRCYISFRRAPHWTGLQATWRLRHTLLLWCSRSALGRVAGDGEGAEGDEERGKGETSRHGQLHRLQRKEPQVEDRGVEQNCANSFHQVTQFMS